MSGNRLNPGDYDRSGDIIPVGCEENNEVIICRKENNGIDDRWDRIIILNTEKVIV